MSKVSRGGDRPARPRDVTGARHGVADSPADDAKATGVQRPEIEIAASCPTEDDVRPAVPGGADQQVGPAVAVHVSGRRDRTPGAVAGRAVDAESLARQRTDVHRERVALPYTTNTAPFRAGKGRAEHDVGATVSR